MSDELMPTAPQEPSLLASPPDLALELWRACSEEDPGRCIFALDCLIARERAGRVNPWPREALLSLLYVVQGLARQEVGSEEPWKTCGLFFAGVVLTSAIAFGTLLPSVPYRYLVTGCGIVVSMIIGVLIHRHVRHTIKWREVLDKTNLLEKALEKVEQ